jgi:mannose-6-phosphate isomerase-like protein (cupin superfamily)
MADKSQRCQQRKDTFHIAMRRSVGFTGGLRRNCAPRLSHYGVAALADAEGAVAHHTNITDAFYVLEGQMRLFLQDPKEEVNLKPGEIHVVEAARPHLVTNGGTKLLTFLVLQGIGEYDYVPLTAS